MGLMLVRFAGEVHDSIDGWRPAKRRPWNAYIVYAIYLPYSRCIFPQIIVNTVPLCTKKFFGYLSYTLDVHEALFAN